MKVPFKILLFLLNQAIESLFLSHGKKNLLTHRIANSFGINFLVIGLSLCLLCPEKKNVLSDRMTNSFSISSFSQSKIRFANSQ
jgi:hypothetical protein